MLPLLCLHKTENKAQIRNVPKVTFIQVVTFMLCPVLMIASLKTLLK